MRLFRVMILVLGMAVGSSAQAGFLFQLDAPSFVLASPGVVSTGIYVTATGADVATFNNVRSISFNLVGSGGGTTITSWVPNPATFPTGTVATIPNPPTSSLLQTSQIDLFGIPTGGSVRIGTLNFNVAAGTTTTFQFNDPNPPPVGNPNGGIANVLVFNGGTPISIDTQVFASPTIGFSVTAVPEPSSIALLALVGAGGLVAHRIRKKKQIIKNA